MAAGKRKLAGAGLATHSTKHSRNDQTRVEADDSSNDSMLASDDSDAESDSSMHDADELKLAGENHESVTSGNIERNKARGATNAEIMALNEASLLFKSNLFKLQIDELLSETLVTAGSKVTRDLDAALKQIRDVLVAMDSTKEMKVDAATNLVRKLGKQATGHAVAIPFPDPAPAAGLALKLAFEAPEVVNVVGSYPLGMAVRTQRSFNVDVLAQMPARMFQERDYMNYRYFYKRAFFVAMIRVQLHASALNELFDIEFELLRSDTRLPVVVLRPKSDTRLAKLGCIVRIQPSIAPDTLPLRRLMPDRNHVRAAYVAGTTDADLVAEQATPQYNAAVVSDALQLTHMKYLFETNEQCTEFGRAAALLRVWLGQRTVQRIGQQQLMAPRISGFALTMVLAWLVRSANSGGVTGARLSSSMDAHQLFKGAIEFLAAHDFNHGALQFGTDADMAVFGAQSGAVLVDPSASVNVLAGVQPWELDALRLHAQQTALDLNHHSANHFSRVFLSAALTDVTAKYDHVFRLDIDMAPFLAARFGSDMNVTARAAELEHGHPVVAVQHRIAQLLSTALARQTRLVAVHAGADASFDDRIKATRRHVFVVGMVTSADAQRLVDLGPSPDAQPQDAAQFRTLWGDRAELRRFRDGSIRLATVWGANAMPLEQRAQIVPRMLAFLLRRHFGVLAQPELLHADDQSTADCARPSEAIGDVTAESAGRLFSLSSRIVEFASTRDLSESDADRVTFEAAIAGFDQLQREVKALEEKLPLRVLALHAVAPGLRYASLAPPKPLALAQGRGDDAYVEPLHVLVEFTTSNKWPDDMAALHKVKSAFLLRLAECYAAAHPSTHVDVSSRFFGYSAQDGLLTGASSVQLAGADDFDYERDSFVDIRHISSGLTFRLSVLCEPEGALLAHKAQEMVRAGLSAQAAALQCAHRRWLRTTQWRAMHHRQILDLCQRHHPAASLTIRLLKRWLSRHMLLGQSVGVPDETAELLAARVFTDPWNGLAAPGSAYAGFVRCLQLLAEWRWTEDMCVVDFAAAGSADSEDSARVASARRVWTTTDGLSADAYATLQAAFDAAIQRKDVRGALRIVTAEDPNAEWWGTVSPVLTRRLQSLARASLQTITDCISLGSDSTLPQVFTAPLTDYDFVIKLDKDVVCRQYEQPPASAFTSDGVQSAESAPRKEVFKNLLPSMQHASQVHVKQHANVFGQSDLVGFDPVALFVRDLVGVYRDSILFFNDVHGGRCIAGLWSPTARKTHPFTASMGANMMLLEHEKVGTKPAATLNKRAVVEEIIRLGEGLVENVVMQNE